MADLRSVEDAQAKILSLVEPLDVEWVPLTAAAGRVVATPLNSRRNLPPTNNSAMDGYAVRSADLEEASEDNPVPLMSVGAQLAGGGGFRQHVRPREVVRIMTGGAVPPGVDAVVMRENTDETNIGPDHTGSVKFMKRPAPGEHIRKKGEDVSRGDEVAAAGMAVTPALLNLLASAGHVAVPVFRRPRVAILASGDELREIGEPYDDDAIINSNAHAIAAAVRQLGGEPQLLGIARDTLEDHRDRMDAAKGADVLVTIGGVSAGTHDFVRPALAALGVELDVFKVAMRPGKPLAFARRGAQRIFGLPGNPVSSLVGFTLFVAPALRRMQGRQEVSPRSLPATLTGGGHKKRVGFTVFSRARATLQSDGGLTCELSPKLSSGMVSGLAWANALCVLRPELDEVKAGDRVAVILLDDTALLC